MNKAELVSYVAENSNGELTKKQAAEAVDLVWEGITKALSAGEKVQLVGILTLEPTVRAARKGYNPQSGEEIDIPASMGVRVKTGKQLQAAVKSLNIKKFANKK